MELDKKKPLRAEDKKYTSLVTKNIGVNKDGSYKAVLIKGNTAKVPKELVKGLTNLNYIK